MKIVLIVYGVSLLIILTLFINTHLKERKTRTSRYSKSKDPWYYYATLIVLAPLVVLAMPTMLINDRKKQKAQQKKDDERKEEERIKEQKKKEIENEFRNESIPLKDYATLIECVLKGKDIVELAEKRRYTDIFKGLDAITMDQGMSLYVEKPKNDWPGDISRLYVLVYNETPQIDYDIYKHLSVEDSCNGAWQIYLLHTLYHLLPQSQHGIYNSRTPIFDQNDIQNIGTIDEPIDLSQVTDDNNFYPIISKKGNKYFVSACYWNDWSGLVRELVTITISNDRIISINDVSDTVIYKYDCGIRF